MSILASDFVKCDLPQTELPPTDNKTEGGTPVARPIKEEFTMQKFYFALFAFAMSFCFLYGDDAQFFICRKCNDSAIKDKQPNISFCRSGGNHLWYELGKIGDQIYVCRKCRQLVTTAARPKINFCKASGNHNWFLLGEKGKDKYRCKKCQMQTCFASKPAINYCFAGGNHDWLKY